MNHTRTNRMRLAMIIMLFASFALGSFWMLEVMRRDTADKRTELPKGEPDYTVERFSFIRMSKSGRVHYAISGAELMHYPDNDSFEITKPVLHSLDDNQAPMTIRADRAIVEHANSKIHLYRDVQLDRPAAPDSEHFHLGSNYLLLLPDTDVIRTDQPVDIWLGQSHLSGTGMIANNATREFRLMSHVRGIYPPHTQ